MKSLRIAIAGAGTTGLAAACFLARSGHDVSIFERFDAPRPLGAGILLQPTGLACLGALGLDGAAISLGARIDAIKGETVRGRRVLDMAYADLAPGYFGLGIHRGALFALLHGEVQRLAVPIVASSAVAATRAVAHGRLVIDASGREHGLFDLVVDATGLRSPLRREVDASVRERPFRWGALWAAVPLPADWPAGSQLRQRYDAASVMVGVLPIGRLRNETQDLAAFFWSLRVDSYEAWRAAGVAAWRRRVTRIWPDVEPLLARLEGPQDLTFATYSDLTMRRTHCDRLVTIGDAAHCTSPQLGQGANLGLADAMVLTRCMDEAGSIEQALASYARARRSHVRFYQRASRWLTPFFQSDSRAAALLRDATFGPMCRVPILRGEMLATLAGIKTGILTRMNPGDWHSHYSSKAQTARGPGGRQPA